MLENANGRVTRFVRVARTYGVPVSRVLLADPESGAAVVWLNDVVNVVAEDEALPEASFVVRNEGFPVSSHFIVLNAVLAAKALLEETKHE